MKTILVDQIDDVVIEILISRGGKKEVRYYVPQGMSGSNFLTFKTKHAFYIEQLKTLKHGNSKIIKIKEEERKHTTINYLPFEFGAQEELSDHLDVQRIKNLGRGNASS